MKVKKGFFYQNYWNKKENTNNLISRIKARANADKNTEEKKSPDSLILRIKRRANADKNKERER